MSDSRAHTQFFSGKSLDDALNQAAQEFSTDRAFVHYRVLDSKNRSLFAKLFSTKVHIEAWIEHGKEDLQKAARNAVLQALGKDILPQKEPEKEKENRPTEKRQFITFQEDAARNCLVEYNERFFSAFDVSGDHIAVQFEEHDAHLHIQDEFFETYLSKSDKFSLAFEHVFKRVAQRKIGDVSGRVTLNAGSSDAKRQERLMSMAQSLAEKVLKTGKSIVLSSKTGQERRVIHMTLDAIEGISTKSIGMGEKRRLVIYAAKNNSGGAAPTSPGGARNPQRHHRVKKRRHNPTSAPKPK